MVPDFKTSEEELAYLDALFSGGRYSVSPTVAAACRERYGRLPRGCEEAKVLPTPEIRRPLVPFAHSYDGPKGAQWKRERKGRYGPR